MSDNNIPQSSPSGDVDSENFSQDTGDNFSEEIDSIFGSAEPDVEDRSAEPVDGENNNPFKGASPDGQDDYANMDPEQVARMFQSKYDKTKAELDKAQEKLQNFDSITEFIDSVYDDEEVRYAFLSEVAPDLVQPKDPYDTLEKKLQEEFGEDFTPDEEEAKRPLSKSWRYYKRLDDLYSESQKPKASLPKSLTELRKERGKQRELQAQKAGEEKQQVLKSMRWAESDYNSFAQWVGKLSATNLAKIYAYATSKGGSRMSPNLATQSGSQRQTPNNYMAELNNFFGK